jgi:Protease inhibitor Inh
MRARGIAGVAIGAMALAACSSINDQTVASQTTTDVMTGRWILTAPNAPSCGINFAGEPGVQQGTLVPEGGCPERFYLSRSWALNQATLVINDDHGQPLAQLTFANARFAGQSTAGTPVTLTRQETP